MFICSGHSEEDQNLGEKTMRPVRAANPGTFCLPRSRRPHNHAVRGVRRDRIFKPPPGDISNSGSDAAKHADPIEAVTQGTRIQQIPHRLPILGIPRTAVTPHTVSHHNTRIGSPFRPEPSRPLSVAPQSSPDQQLLALRRIIYIHSKARSELCTSTCHRSYWSPL